MGGMAAQIPIKGDTAANEAALEKVRQDKLREVTDGHDGTWVAHPALVPVALEVFDAAHADAQPAARPPRGRAGHGGRFAGRARGPITEAGPARQRERRALVPRIVAAGQGCVPIYNLMEDAATAEICRTQIWQWIRHPRGVLDDGRGSRSNYSAGAGRRARRRLRATVGDAEFEQGKYRRAAEIMDEHHRQRRIRRVPYAAGVRRAAINVPRPTS